MRLKHCKLLAFYCIMIVHASMDNDFIYDYFVYKKVPSVVGFTCDTANEDVLIKRLNRMGIKIMLYKLYHGSINRLIQTNHYKLGIFIDIRCYDSVLVAVALSEAANNRLYDELRCWLLLGNSLKNIIQTVDDRSFGLSTDFVIVPMNSSSKELILYDAYNPWKQGHGNLSVTRLATWNSEGGLTFHVIEMKIMRRCNLHGMMFKTAFFSSKYKAANVSLEHYLENAEKNTIDGFTKFGYIILKYVSEMFNFSLHIGEITKWEKGDMVGPMSRALNNNDIDISGNPVLMSVPRLRMAKFVYPSWPLRTCFLLRSPQPNDMKFGEILRPFDLKIWYLMTLTLIISGMTLFLVLKFESYDDARMCCSNSLLINIGALCQQGTNILLNKMSSRITFLNIMVYSYLMFNYYSACVVSARLSEPIVKINDSLNELLKTGLKVASEPLLYFDFFIKENKWETKMFYSQRWLTTPESERFMHPNEGIKLVKQGSHAYHTHPEVGYPYINRFYTNREICELTEVNLAKLTYSTMAVTYNSTVVELMKIGFARLSEYGIRRRQLNWLTTKKPHCHRDILTATSVTMNEFAPHLVVLVFGVIIATVICTIERHVFEYYHDTESGLLLRSPRFYEWLRRRVYDVNICSTEIQITDIGDSSHNATYVL